MEENHMGWKLVSGVRQDILKLFKTFASSNSVRYEDFCKAWKEMKFTTIYKYRANYIEKVEFIEEVFQIVKEYLISLYDLQIRISALYTLYALYFTQPLSEPAKIRFTKSEWEEIQPLITLCKNEKHYDAAFIYLKMYLSGAFIFTATVRTKGLEMGFRKYFKKRYTLLPNTYDPELFYRPILSENIVTKLVQLEQLYCKKKSELPGKKRLEFINTSFSQSLQEELKNYESGSLRLTSKVEDNKKEENGTPASAELGQKSTKTKSSKSGKRKNHKTDRIERQKAQAKKKAEIYIKQLQEKKRAEESSQEKSCFELPDLDCI